MNIFPFFLFNFFFVFRGEAIGGEEGVELYKFKKIVEVNNGLFLFNTISKP